ncbi:MAG: RNA polymerase sigma factor, partial [Akkermansiaceae bacterium]
MNNQSATPSNPEQDPAETLSMGENDPNEDLRWVSLAQQGDMNAFNQLVIRHQGKIYAMIRNMVRNE